MITIKTKEDIAILREGGKRHAQILEALRKMVRSGISAEDLDREAYRLILENGDKPAFLNYKPRGEKGPFPASLCVSVNDEVVHGIPYAHKILKEGDIVTLDLGLIHKG
ncbi:MAG TPA: M24 family metallopeptidase, partial [Candidatus Paceibacterota bacterium]